MIKQLNYFYNYIIKLQEISAIKSKKARDEYQLYINNIVSKEQVIKLQEESNFAGELARNAYLDYVNFFRKYLKYKKKYLNSLQCSLNQNNNI